MEESSPVVTVKPERPIPVTVRVNGHRMPKAGPEYDPGTVFLLEYATLLTLRDEETIAAAGEGLTGILQSYVRDASNLHPLAVSRVVNYLLELLRHSYVSGESFRNTSLETDMEQTHDFMRAPVVMHAISSFDDTVLDRTAPTIIQGLTRIISQPDPLRNEVTKSPDFWSTLQRLHQHKTEAEHVFEILTTLATARPTALTADNYEATISLANDFATAGSIGSIQEKRKDFAAKRGHQAKLARPEDIVVVQRANKAIGLIYQLTDLTPSLIEQSHLERREAWAADWSPVFRALCAQCVNPCREVRHRALSALQRVLLAENVADGEDHTEWTAIFDEVLFPMTLRLLKPEIYQLDPAGMNDTRAQAAAILCKIFLRYLEPLANCGRLPDIWVKVLELLDRLMNAGTETDALAEAVREGVKNVLLVMDGTGYLERNGNPAGVAPPHVEVPQPTPPGKPTGGDATGDEPDDEDNDNEAGDSNRGKEEQKQKNEQQPKIMVWRETNRRLDRFLPGLIEELFPTPPPAAATAPAGEGTQPQTGAGSNATAVPVRGGPAR